MQNLQTSLYLYIILFKKNCEYVHVCVCVQRTTLGAVLAFLETASLFLFFRVCQVS